MDKESTSDFTLSTEYELKDEVKYELEICIYFIKLFIY